MAAKCVMVLARPVAPAKLAGHGLVPLLRAPGLKVAPFKAQNMSNNARLWATVPGAKLAKSPSIFQA